MIVKLDRVLNNWENSLTEVASCPIIGTPAGLVKIGMGLVQTVAALAASILFLFYGLSSKNWILFDYSCSHIRHGIGNIAAGTIESIPILGTILYEFRKSSKKIDELPKVVSNVFCLEYWTSCLCQCSGYPEIDDNGKRTKFMVYDSLAQDDIKIIPFRHGIPRGDCEKANEIYQRKLNDPTKKNQSKLSLAEESIEEYSAECRQEEKRLREWLRGNKEPNKID